MERAFEETVGCVVYDDPTRPESGWYARNEEVARRLLPGQALPDSALWLTNLAYEQGVEAFSRWPEGFACQGYLREDLSAFAKRHGISDSRILAECGAKLLSRIMALSRAYFGQSHFLPALSLRHGLKDCLGTSEMLVTPDLCAIIEEATITNISCRTSQDALANRPLLFCLEPRRHCLALLDQRFPYGRFAPLPEAALPKEPAGREAVLSFAKDLQARPGFFQITCLHLDEPWASLFRFGPARGTRLGKGRCLWVSWPELRFLAERADLLVHAALLPASSRRLFLPQELASFFPEASVLSVSCGLFFENVWNALAQTSRRQKRFLRQLVAVNPVTPFLRAKDSLLLCETAAQLQSLGLTVTGFANGRLRLDAGEHQASELYAMATTSGCIPPMLAFSDNSAPCHKAASAFALHAQWSAQGLLLSLLTADRLIVEKLLASSQARGLEKRPLQVEGA